MAAYTNHIGHSSRDNHSGKNTAISTVGDLKATEKHNNHDYKAADVARMQSDISLEHRHLNRHYVVVDGELVEFEGHLDLAAHVRKIYEEEFADVVSEYNEQQVAAGHSERQISSYLEKISKDKQQEVAVEGLIQIGSFEEEWKGATMDEKQKVVPILVETLKETLRELNKVDGGNVRKFVLAGASLHLNEGSPHIHYVGVPIQETPNAQRGLKKRVKKTAVFTKDTLGTGLQDNVRAKIEPLIREAFGWEFDEKKTGRNEDREKNTEVNEILKEQIKENRSVLAKVNKSIQTIEEYNLEADELKEELERTENKLDNIDELGKLVPIHKRRRAAAIIEELYQEIQKSIEWMKRVVEVLFGFERSSNMPEKKRRAPRLDERIKQAEARVKDEPRKGQEEYHW